MILFSASKQMNSTGNLKKIKLTKQNKEIYLKMNSMSKESLSKFLKIKNKTLDLTYDYYNNEKVIYNKAIDAYEGLSFRQITCRKNLDNLYIISALNGIVKSDEEIFNYRLDFTNNPLDISLYKYHRNYIVKQINDAKSRYILNLASNEYFNAVDKEQINKKIIDLEISNEKVNSVFLKKMRGQLVNHCLENNIKNYYRLDNFENELFKVSKSNNKLVITFKEL